MKRWIIRSFFIALLLLCVGGWVWSSIFVGAVAFTHDKHTLSCGTDCGVITVGSDAPTPLADGWDAFFERKPSIRFWPGGVDPARSYYFLGFEYFKNSFAVAVPYWFLIVISVGLLWFAWRKTRPKPKGFPVEVQSSKAE